MFSCEIYNISKKTNFYRKFPMTVSENLVSKSLIALSKNFVVRNFAKIKRNPLNFAKFLLTPFYRTPLDDCSGPLDNSKVKGKDSFNSSFPELLNMFLIVWSAALIIIFRAHLFRPFVNLSEKVKFLPTDTHTQVSVSGVRMLTFAKNLANILNGLFLVTELLNSLK